ncbi:hypothetical protein NQ318_004442 [Aromia moschata]|uniref:Uncharacterized protein n=1 Tax=Aromia moschata TaxID=1265417 RepID=A0AAV8XNP0_9CUCU|nr:hypothetical protein NQ318_004442 [Aromia moschata]
MIKTLSKHTDYVHCITNNGKDLISGGEDGVLCGGGPRLSGHYRFLTNSTIFPIEDKGIHVAEIFSDKIFAGGRSKLFYQMSFIGDIISEIPTSAVTTYSIIHQTEPFEVLSIAGSSPKIDICNKIWATDFPILSQIREEEPTALSTHFDVGQKTCVLSALVTYFCKHCED